MSAAVKTKEGLQTLADPVFGLWLRWRQHIVTLAFSPLFTLTTPTVDIVLGPKLGFWDLSAEV